MQYTADQIEQAVIAKFGDQIVPTRIVSAFFAEELGMDYGNYYNAFRMKYGAGRGMLQFSNNGTTGYTFTPSAIAGAAPQFEPEPVVVETDEEIEERLNIRFRALDVMSRATAKGINRAMIVSGPAGLGKTFSVEKAATELVPEFVHIKGYVRATGLYKTLYMNRHKGCLIILDDADSIFSDETALNLLKAACDSSEIRKLCWLSQATLETDDGEEIPNSFEFEGSMIFVTNLDFQQQIDKGNRLAPHFEAMVSRSHYLSLGIKNKRDYIIRIKQVLKQGMLDTQLTQEYQDMLVEYMTENMNSLRELSLRMAKKLADLICMDIDNWKDLASITCHK